ncbi:MAG: Uma2 family endonuclease [Actinomycetota bacterium]|nr:Uma2 family endonuclease [Actinomycetota bacterium]
MATNPQTRLTYSDLEEMYPEVDNVRRELIDGELFVSASPVKRHQAVVLEIGSAFLTYAKDRGGEAFASPMDVYFSEDNVVEPDVIYVGPDRVDRSEPRFLRAVTLVVEVSLPSTRRLELLRKRELYERYAVPEYWYVDLDVDRIEIYRLEGGAFAGPVMMSRGKAIASPELPGFSAQVDDLLGPDPGD